MADLIELVRAAAGLQGRDEALAALRTVVCALRERLSAEEVEELRGALSALPEVFTCEDAGHTHRVAERARDRLTEPEVVARVQAELRLPDLPAARRVTSAVLSVLADEVATAPAQTAANEAVSVGSLGRPRPDPAEDEDDG